MTTWSFVVDIFVIVGTLIATLQYFDLTPKSLAGGSPMSLGRRWKLAIMLGLMAISLSLSGFGFYRSLRPRIVEKIVEKPVDRVVEKSVQAECPQSPKGRRVDTSKKQLVLPPGTVIEAKTVAPDSAAVGINTGTVNVNPDPTKPVITYFLNGEQRISTPGNIAGALGERDAYNEMLKLTAEQQWTQVLSLSDAEIEKAPKWITAYYYKALAEASLQHFGKAIELFNYVETNARGEYRLRKFSG